jgi:transcription factor TFIIIB component B''
MTYLNRRSTDRWASTDTELFYKALTIFGTDFTAIAKLFPGRDR